jgi:hypothetical protein
MPRKGLLFACLFTAVHILVLHNLVLLSRDFLLGDGSAERVLPTPRYELVRVEDDPASRVYQAQNRLAVDFAQIYFPSRYVDRLRDNYETGELDPLQRPSRYAPLLAIICSVSLCRLEYGPASLLHMVIQLAVFLGCLGVVLRALKMGRLFLPALLVANIALFLTPAGLSWFERGQFSLYAAAGYLLLLAGLLRGEPKLVLAAAPLAFIKWTSLPYLPVAFSILLFAGTGAAERKRILVLGAAFASTFAILTLATPVASVHFLQGLLEQESTAIPGGISLAKVLPLPLAKLLPVPLIALGYLHVRSTRRRKEALIPFLAGSAVLMQTYPTLAYDYNMPVLLGVLAPILYWGSLPNTGLPRPGRRLIEYAFLLLLLASYSNYILPRQNWMSFCAHLLVGALLLGLPLRAPRGWPDHGQGEARFARGRVPRRRHESGDARAAGPPTPLHSGILDRLKEPLREDRIR